MKKLLLTLPLLLIVSGSLAQINVIRVPANTDFQMAWTPGANCQDYEVERSLDDGSTYNNITEVSGELLTTQLAENQTAIYRVRGFRDETEGRVVGPYSDPSDPIMGAVYPEAPKLLNVIEIVYKWILNKS